MLITRCDFCKRDIDKEHTLYHLQDVNHGMSRYSTLDICDMCLDRIPIVVNVNPEIVIGGVVNGQNRA